LVTLGDNFSLLSLPQSRQRTFVGLSGDLFIRVTYPLGITNLPVTHTKDDELAVHFLAEVAADKR